MESEFTETIRGSSLEQLVDCVKNAIKLLNEQAASWPKDMRIRRDLEMASLKLQTSIMPIERTIHESREYIRPLQDRIECKTHQEFQIWQPQRLDGGKDDHR